eukprot:1260578-Amphidinium_carterae.1
MIYTARQWYLIDCAIHSAFLLRKNGHLLVMISFTTVRMTGKTQDESSKIGNPYETTVIVKAIFKMLLKSLTASSKPTTSHSHVSWQNGRFVRA